ncbi:MAG: molybdopterin-dependent oxidoreductase [Chloroflexota bacterium]
MQTTSAASDRWLDRAGKAGALAALAMLFVQLLWRAAAGGGAPSFPETIVGAVARLTPYQVFGWITETFGAAAQNTLFALTLAGIVAVGWRAGRRAGDWATAGRFGRGPGGPLAAGLAMAALLALAVFLVILPLAGLGFFGLESRHAARIVAQTALTFALWGLLWAWLAGEPATAGIAAAAAGAPGAESAVPEAGGAAASPVSRRAAIETGAASPAALALLGGVGVLGWRLARSQPAPDPLAAGEAARSIEATAEARARAAAVPATPAAAPAATPAAASAPAPGKAGEDPEGAAAPDAAATPAAPEAAALPSFADLEAGGRLSPRLTPLGDFYHVSKNIADPRVAADGWSLEITGLVDTPKRYTLAELQARSTVRRITTLACISNELNGPLIGTAEWSGVTLGDLLAEAGVKAGVVDLVFTCADDYQDSITLERALDPDTMLVTGMNGAPLTDDHGFPARMIVPGIYGMKNVKWVETIELVDTDFQGFWQTRGWSDPAPYQIWGRIDTPASGDDVPAGPAVAAGMASAGDRGVSRVEVSLDEGATWADADLEPAINAPFTWVRWRFGFEARDSGDLWIRVTDGEGSVAPQEERPPLPDGATGWPSRRINVTG